MLEKYVKMHRTGRCGVTMTVPATWRKLCDVQGGDKLLLLGRRALVLINPNTYKKRADLAKIKEKVAELQDFIDGLEAEKGKR